MLFKNRMLFDVKVLQIPWFATSSNERILCLFSQDQASRHSLKKVGG